MLNLESDSPFPLYYQLGQAIKNEIQSGRWKSGEMIASERELMRMAKVSRATVRQAIALLTREGILKRVQGRGTFVAEPKLEQELHRVYSFAQHMRSMGLEHEDRIIQRELLVAPLLIADKLGVAIGEKLIHLQRLRSLNGRPMMINNSYLPYALCPELLQDDIGFSLYQYLADTYGIVLSRSKDTLECIKADPAVAYHLKVEKDTPLMYLERVAYTKNELPAQLEQVYIRGDAIRFRVNLSSASSSMELK